MPRLPRVHSRFLERERGSVPGYSPRCLRGLLATFLDRVVCSGGYLFLVRLRRISACSLDELRAEVVRARLRSHARGASGVLVCYLAKKAGGESGRGSFQGELGWDGAD
jgi:hypothetical protein